MKSKQNNRLCFQPAHLILLFGLLLSLAVITPVGLAQGRILIYVDAGASGANTGTSWANAYTHLQDALDQTNANSGTDYEIWVAEGVYYPDEESVGSEHTAGSESEYFTLRYNNVQVYGGFAGTETSRDPRDWTTHPTILSGDIDGNDLNPDGNHIAETSADIQGDNADHVLYLTGVSNEMIDRVMVIDGFTITAGQANHSSFYGGGLYCAASGSGYECNPHLVNVNFSGNIAGFQGGGMFNHGAFSGDSSPSLVNVSFDGNSADYYGGGMYNDGGSSGNSSPSLNNVSFNGNSAAIGGGMYNNGDSGNSNPNLVSVSFSGNSATDGGGMYNDGGSSGNSSPSLNNVSFSDNSAEHYGGGMYNNGNSGSSNPTLVNGSFSGNSAGWNGGGIYNNGESGNSSPSLVNARFKNNSADSFGGAMYNNGSSGSSSPSLVNVSFSGNSANYGGAMYNNGRDSGNSNPNLINVSFSDNSAVAYGGAIFNTDNSNPNIVNVILWGNTASYSGPQVFNSSTTPTFTHSLIEGGISGLGTDGGNNLDQDPLFVDAANGDLSLQSGSPAIDAGLSAALPADTFDLDGDGDTTEPIPFDLAGQARNQGSAVDIGAYEYAVNTAPTISEGNSVEATMSVNGSPVAFSLTLHASDPEGDLLTWSIASPASHGTASASGTGNSKAIDYTPDTDYSGTDSFVVQVSDGQLTDTITVTVNVTAEEIGQSLYLPLIIK